MINYETIYRFKRYSRNSKNIKRKFFNSGPRIKIFEKKISKYFSSDYTTVVSNGSAALVITGKILNWKKMIGSLQHL